jgi:hypothetical protein
MPPLAGQPIFSVEGASYTWEDVVLAACLWGDWPALEACVRDGLACVARLDDLDEDDPDVLDESEVDAAAEEFRYARDLIAAADLEQWLEARGLTVDGWLDALRRGLLRARWADQLDAIRARYEPDDEDTAEALVGEAVCTGLALGLSQRLAARAAIHARRPAIGADGPSVEAEALAARAVPALVPDVRRQRLARLAGLEVSWRGFMAEAAPAEALTALVAGRGLDWVRLTTTTVVAPDEDVAHEMVLCVRVDRRPLEEVAADAGLAVRTAEFWLEDVEEVLRDALVGARPGEVLGPLPTKAGPAVVVVRAKVAPAVDDPAVRARAEHALLARTVERELADRVTWHVTF